MRVDPIMVAAIRHVSGTIKLTATEHRWSRLRAVVDLRAVVNIEDRHDTAVLIDPIDDAIGTSPSAVTADERQLAFSGARSSAKGQSWDDPGSLIQLDPRFRDRYPSRGLRTLPNTR